MTNAPSAVIVFKQILNNKNDEEFYKSSAPGFGIMNDKTGGEKTVKKRLLLLLICMLFLLSGYTAEAAKNEEKTTYLFAMDTTMTIRVFGGDDALMQSLQKRVNEIENQVSVTREYSDIYRLNHEGNVAAGPDTETILNRALDICGETEGALDVSIYPVVREWGFTTGEYRVPSLEKLEELLASVDYKKVESSEDGYHIPDGMAVDLGSVTKGYTGDVLAGMIRSAGVKSAIMDLGGNIHTVGKKQNGAFWRVAVRSPEGTGLVGVLEVADEAVITSGGYERFFEDEDGNVWWHIIDPKTGYPAKNGVISMTIVGKEGIRCDALSTALFVMGPEKAAEFWRTHGDFEMIMITEEGELFITPSLNKRFTPDALMPYHVTVLS